MSSDAGALLFVAFIALAIWVWVRGERRAVEHIEQWAADSGYRVGMVQRRWLWKGRFFMRATRYQRVYDVSFVDKNGHVRGAQVRVGNWLLGALVGEVRVDWDGP